jgi:hypothetical protein
VVVAKVQQPTEDHSDVIFEPERQPLGIYLGKTLSIVAAGLIVIPVVNLNVKSVTLNKDTCVGSVSTFEGDPMPYPQPTGSSNDCYKGHEIELKLT